jgi:hypothetical protein
MSRNEWLFRLIVVPIFVVSVVITLIGFGDNSEILTCAPHWEDGLCVVTVV